FSRCGGGGGKPLLCFHPRCNRGLISLNLFRSHRKQYQFARQYCTADFSRTARPFLFSLCITFVYRFLHALPFLRIGFCSLPDRGGFSGQHGNKDEPPASIRRRRQRLRKTTGNGTASGAKEDASGCDPADRGRRCTVQRFDNFIK
uniref:Uncharacterized protein n=1 Tax=Anopheles atroparvus TaxID=41427 RepID=A0AAG5D5P1_ANOAO